MNLQEYYNTNGTIDLSAYRNEHINYDEDTTPELDDVFMLPTTIAEPLTPPTPILKETKKRAKISKDLLDQALKVDNSPYAVAHKLVSTGAFNNIRLMQTDLPFDRTDQLYCINAKNELELTSQDALIHEKIVAPGFAQSLRHGTILLEEVKAILNSKGMHLDQKEIHALGFADDPYTVWKRLDNTRANLLANPPPRSTVPEFCQFLDRCDDPYALILFLGSMLDPNSGRKQYLHMQGNGNDGKSQLCNALQDLLQGRCRSIRADRLIRDNHFGTELEGCRLALFLDENDAGFFSNGKFKSLTGDDYMQVNPKNQPVRSIKLEAKFLIASNSEVRITSGLADTSRLISIVVSTPSEDAVKADPDWATRLRASAEQILEYCYAQYAQAVAKDPSIRKKIPCSEKNINAAIVRRYATLEEQFEYLIDLDPTKKIARVELHQILLGHDFKNPYKLNELKDFLLTQKKLKEIKIQGKHYYGGVMPKVADAQGRRVSTLSDLTAEDLK